MRSVFEFPENQYKLVHLSLKGLVFNWKYSSVRVPYRKVSLRVGIHVCISACLLILHAIAFKPLYFWLNFVMEIDYSLYCRYIIESCGTMSSVYVSSLKNSRLLKRMKPRGTSSSLQVKVPKILVANYNL